MSRKRDVLEHLKRDELLTTADRLELEVEDRRLNGRSWNPSRDRGGRGSPMRILTTCTSRPPAKLLATARKILEPMPEQIIALQGQIYNLRRTRDLLLPRFLPGQIIHPGTTS